jgi:sensor histidine kinase YesM
MTIQPLVENAYIHGVSKSDEGGEIVLTATQTEYGVKIVISNTGEDISPETIRLILERKLKPGRKSAQQGHTTGIGTDNVLQRLRLFFNTDDVMEILCGDGKTDFILKLPSRKSDWSDADVPDPDS